MIIGVTGNYASGKDTVADILQEMNFFHVSFSDILREELKRREQEVNRDNLITVGNELRERHGASVLAKKALEKVKDGENYVFSSIRNPKEVELLQNRGDFILINVIAPEEVRFQRMIERPRGESDPKSIEELREKEAKENTSDPNAQQLNKVASMSKISIMNDSTLDELRNRMNEVVREWLYRLQDTRPSWDQYFMNIAEQVKTRCNCMSAKKAAIIVKDKMILSTGYNGSPKGITHCSSGGCQRCTARHLGQIKSGVYSEPCICCHAEENVIVQAAFQGTSTKDGTIYTTFTPCTTCAKMIINAGIKRVVAKVTYPDDVGTKLLKKAGVELLVLD